MESRIVGGSCVNITSCPVQGPYCLQWPCPQSGIHVVSIQDIKGTFESMQLRGTLFQPWPHLFDSESMSCLTWCERWTMWPTSWKHGDPALAKSGVCGNLRWRFLLSQSQQNPDDKKNYRAMGKLAEVICAILSPLHNSLPVNNWCDCI